MSALQWIVAGCWVALTIAALWYLWDAHRTIPTPPHHSATRGKRYESEDGNRWNAQDRWLEGDLGD